MFRTAGVLAVVALSAQAQPKAEAACAAGDARACEAAAVRAAELGNEARARDLLRRADLLDQKAEDEARCAAGDARACEAAATVSDDAHARALRERAEALKKAAQPPPVSQPEVQRVKQSPAAACEAGSAAACDEAAVEAAVKGDTETARLMLGRAEALRAGAPAVLPPPSGKAELPAPPLIAADEPEQEPQLPRRRAPLPAPEPRPRNEPAPTPPAPAPSSPVGIVGVGGLEIAVPVNSAPMSLRPRVGAGLRFALNRRQDSGDGYVPSPSAGFVVGYAGLENSPRFFAEGRVELLVNRPGGLFQPGFAAYAITGLDVHVRGGAAVDPYVGAGLGWDVNIFEKRGDEAVAKPKRSGWGGGWGWGGSWGGASVLGLILLPAIIGFVCAGRVEFRYHPVGVRGPASVDVLVGLGF